MNSGKVSNWVHWLPASWTGTGTSIVFWTLVICPTSLHELPFSVTHRPTPSEPAAHHTEALPGRATPQAPSGADALQAAHVRPQRLGDGDRAVGLLVRLHHHVERPGQGQG